MSLSSQTLSQEDLNLLRNDRIKFDCSPLVYHSILEWSFAKPKGVKIIDHFKALDIVEKCGRNLNSWLKKNNDALQKDEYSSFDVTTLHDLLPVLCYDKVTQTGGKEWENKLKDKNSIEYLLKEIKSFRNDVSHEYSKAKEDPNIEAKRDLMRKCIRTAGALCNKAQSEIDEKIEHLDVKFDEVVQKTNSSYENAVQYVTNKIERECPTFMLEKYSPLFTVPLPGGLGKIDSSQIFDSVNISVAVEDIDETQMLKYATLKEKDEKNKIVFSSSAICNYVSNNFVVINGGPGSGKTTFLKHLFQNILDNSVKGCETSYKGIGKFRVPIYVECRTEKQNNLRDFLKENTLNFNSPKEVIYDAFKEVKRQVFLIDGYDEVNDDSKKLVDEIIPFCSKYNATCIVTGRVDAGNNFISNLQERKLSYNEMLIEPISKMSDKLSFLKRYGDKMGNVDSNQLVKSFENLNDSAQKVFFCPILLALFISLFVNHRGSLSHLHNEQSAYKAIREIFTEEIEKKLKKSNCANPELKAKYLLEVFSDYSLRLFRNEKYFFEKEEFLSLSEDCLQRISNNDVDIKGIFSCILNTETSLKSQKALTYAFTHSTIQEYLAVEHIIKNMRESGFEWSSDEHSEDRPLKQFLEILGVFTSLLGASTSLSDVKKEVRRYGNIIKLLILELLANGDFKIHTKTFTAVLGKYFEDDEEFLLDMIFSSSCETTIVSLVSNVLKDEKSYKLYYTCHIRPLTEVLKKHHSTVVIKLDFSESLTDTTCINLGQLVSLLKDGSTIELHFKHSYENYQPLNGKFYTQLKYSKCKVTKFRACVMSSEHLSIVMRVLKGTYPLFISTSSACDVNFITLLGHKGKLWLMVKYTDNCPSHGDNPVTEGTILTITDIPADCKDNVFNTIKYLCPKSKEFWSIELVNCHLTDIDINELLKMLEGQKISTKWGERTGGGKRSVNGDKSRNLELYLLDNEKREAARRETDKREAIRREAAQREAEMRGAARREAEQKEAEQRQAAQLKAAQQEAKWRKTAQREAARREAERREAERQEAAQREAARREAERQEAERREAARREAEQQEAARILAEQRRNKSVGKFFRDLFSKF